MLKKLAERFVRQLSVLEKEVWIRGAFGSRKIYKYSIKSFKKYIKESNNGKS
jgi:hypothetical protein